MISHPSRVFTPVPKICPVHAGLDPGASLFQLEGAGLQFSEQLKVLRHKAGKSRYRLAQYSGLNEAYILRLESGERSNPSRDVVIMLALALAQGVSAIEILDLDALLLSADYAPLRRRGEGGVSAHGPDAARDSRSSD